MTYKRLEVIPAICRYYLQIAWLRGYNGMERRSQGDDVIEREITSHIRQVFQQYPVVTLLLRRRSGRLPARNREPQTDDHPSVAGKSGSSGLSVLGGSAQEASQYVEAAGVRKEKRRFRGEYATPVISVRVGAMYAPSPSVRVVVRGRNQERTAHQRTPPAKSWDGCALPPQSPPPPRAGLFLLPALNRLLALAHRGRPQRPGRGNGPHVTPLP